MGRDAGYRHRRGYCGGADGVSRGAPGSAASSKIAAARAGRTSALVVVADLPGNRPGARQVDGAPGARAAGPASAVAGHRLTSATGAAGACVGPRPARRHADGGGPPEGRPGRARGRLMAGKSDCMVGWWNRTVIDVQLETVVGS